LGGISIRNDSPCVESLAKTKDGRPAAIPMKDWVEYTGAVMTAIDEAAAAQTKAVIGSVGDILSNAGGAAQDLFLKDLESKFKGKTR